jgi:hypothetical protein
MNAIKTFDAYFFVIFLTEMSIRAVITTPKPMASRKASRVDSVTAMDSCLI